MARIRRFVFGMVWWNIAKVILLVGSVIIFVAHLFELEGGFIAIAFGLASFLFSLDRLEVGLPLPKADSG